MKRALRRDRLRNRVRDTQVDADPADLGEAVKAKAFAGHGDQHTSSTNSDVAAKLDGPSAKGSRLGHASEREHLGNIRGAERHDRSPRLHHPSVGIRKDHLVDGVSPDHRERGGGSTSSVVNNAIRSSPPTKASSDRNEAGSMSIVAAKGAMAAG